MFQKIKKTFSDQSYCFRKFWVFQFVISLLGIMVTLPLSTFISQNPGLGNFPYLIAAAFCGGLFCFLIYDVMFQLGGKDSISVATKKIEYSPKKGLYIALIAYIPTYFVLLLELIFKVVGYGDGFTVTHVILNMGIHAQYSGLMFLFPDSLGYIADIIAVLFAPIFAFLGYYLALNEKTLRGVLGIKVKPKTKK